MVVHVFIKLFTISISECELGPYVKFIAATRHSLQAGNARGTCIAMRNLVSVEGFYTILFVECAHGNNARNKAH